METRAILILWYSISHPDLALVWRDMTTIKINILQRIDSSALATRVCCIKFLQKVVQVQTPGVISDPRVSPCSVPKHDKELTRLTET